MTQAPLIIIVIASGYTFLFIYNFTKFDFFKDSGYHLFFKASLIGFPLWGLADVSITFLVNPYIPIEIPSNGLVRPSLGVLYGIVISSALNFLVRKRDWEKEVAVRRRNSLHLEIMDAISRNQHADKIQFLEFAMKSGKKYAGFPELFKLRDEYVNVILSDAKGARYSDYKICLRAEEIEAVRLYRIKCTS